MRAPFHGADPAWPGRGATAAFRPAEDCRELREMVEASRTRIVAGQAPLQDRAQLAKARCAVGKNRGSEPAVPPTLPPPGAPYAIRLAQERTSVPAMAATTAPAAAHAVAALRRLTQMRAISQPEARKPVLPELPPTRCYPVVAKHTCWGKPSMPAMYEYDRPAVVAKAEGHMDDGNPNGVPVSDKH